MEEKNMTKETSNKVDTNETWLDSHDLNELIETTKLEILPKYDLIQEDDLLTSRKVIIESLPESKEIVKNGKTLNLTFITIRDNDIKYSLPFNSKALQRSLIQIAIKESKAIKQTDIDLSKVIGKFVGLKREQFEAKGFIQQPYKFYSLD